MFFAQGYQVQHFGNQEHMVVQFRQGSEFEALIGLQAALTLTLQHVPGGVVATIGQQQWVDKAVAGAIGAFFLWPLLVTAGAGILRQSQLEGQMFQTLDMVVHQQKADVRVGPVPFDIMEQMRRQAPPPPHTQADYQPGTPFSGRQCSACQEINELGDAFCSRCGKPLTSEKPEKRCPQCKAEVRSSATFCTKCGTPLTQ
jgi:hypothetical protein